MMAFGKKGIATRTIVILVTFCLVFFLMYNLAGGYEGVMSRFSSSEQCRYTLQIASTTNDKVIAGGKGIAEIKCSRDRILLGKEYIKGGRYDKDKVFYKFGEEIDKCFYKTGEGKIYGTDKNWFKSKNLCIICTEIYFERKESNPTFEGFHKYLEETKVNNQQTYSQHITESSDLTWYDQIDTKKSYYIVYTTHSKGFLLNNKANSDSSGILVTDDVQEVYKTCKDGIYG